MFPLKTCSHLSHCHRHHQHRHRLNHQSPLVAISKVLLPSALDTLQDSCRAIVPWGFRWRSCWGWILLWWSWWSWSTWLWCYFEVSRPTKSIQWWLVCISAVLYAARGLKTNVKHSILLLLQGGDTHLKGKQSLFGSFGGMNAYIYSSLVWTLLNDQGSSTIILCIVNFYMNIIIHKALKI